MKQRLGYLALMALAFLLVAAPGYSASTEELEKKIDLLADEVDDLKNRGFGAGTSDHNRVTIHGYGEMHFNHNTTNSTTEIDNHRFVIGIHALLTDWIHLNAEIDFEKAAQELEFEFAHLDFLLSPGLNARAGVMLAPVGLLNEFHEPNLFWTVERGTLQKRLIPTTWNSGGAGIFGTPMDGVNYRVYAMNSLQSITRDATKDGSGSGGSGGSGSSFGTGGIRGGRAQVNERLANDWSVYARVEFSKLLPGLQVGFSLVNGDTTQGIIEEGGNMLLLEADIKYRWNWFDMNATVINIEVDDAQAMNTFCDDSVTAINDCVGGIASNNFGFNIQAGVHLPQLLGWKTSHDIVPHFRFERVRTQDEMPAGTSPDKSKNRNAIYTVGVSYLPIPEVALKIDHTRTETQDNRSDSVLALGIAYMY